MYQFMSRYTQKDLINLFLGKCTKKRGTTGLRLEMPVQRGEPVRAALVHICEPGHLSHLSHLFLDLDTFRFMLSV